MTMKLRVQGIFPKSVRSVGQLEVEISNRNTTVATIQCSSAGSVCHSRSEIQMELSIVSELIF